MSPALKKCTFQQQAMQVIPMHMRCHSCWLLYRYETSNHLWLILEYCVGGDLMSLLRQDMLLPESSIHDFGRDLVISIQYLHSNAIIYCDLKPSNILLDENGRIKLGGFGLSRRLSDINKTSLQQLPPVRTSSVCTRHKQCLSHTQYVLVFSSLPLTSGLVPSLVHCLPVVYKTSML